MLQSSKSTKLLKTNMEIKPLSESNQKEALCFVRNHEKTCVSLMEHLMTSTENVFVLCRGSFIYGIIYFRNLKTVLHCLPFAKEKSEENKPLINQTIILFKEFFEGQNVFCINGERFGSALLIKAISLCSQKKRPSVLTKYFLMECNSPQEKNLSNESGYAIKKAKKTDAKKLFKLEEEYQRVEVVPEGLKVSSKNLEESFLHSFTDSKIFYIAKWSGENPEGGEIICKAAINSVSENYGLIGGVFTKSKYRKKGFAAVLVNHLVRIINIDNKKAVLFVKEKNLPAVSLYRKIGFKNIDQHVLAYYF